MTASELSGLLGIALRGDGSRVLTGAAVLDEAETGQLAFVGSAKYFASAAQSRAGCLIAPAEYAAAEGQTVLDSPQPRAHFAQALALLYPVAAVRPGIHPYAVVGGQGGVGDKARIEARSVIGSGAGILTSKIVRAGEPVWGTPARPLRQYLAQLATLSRLAKKRGSS